MCSPSAMSPAAADVLEIPLQFSVCAWRELLRDKAPKLCFHIFDVSQHNTTTKCILNYISCLQTLRHTHTHTCVFIHIYIYTHYTLQYIYCFLYFLIAIDTTMCFSDDSIMFLKCFFPEVFFKIFCSNKLFFLFFSFKKQYCFIADAVQRSFLQIWVNQ